MIKVSVMYPNEPGARFDLEYYQNKHIPLIRELLGSACTAVTLDKGISGRPGEPPIYSVICDIYSESLAIFLEAFRGQVETLDADVIHFTDLKSKVQISEVLVSNMRNSKINH
jgi:uncharacterized protein (TIGR02118 family)